MTPAAVKDVGLADRKALNNRLLRISACMTLVGLWIELVALIYFEPATFLLFVIVGVGLLIAGPLLYCLVILSILKQRGAL